MSVNYFVLEMYLNINFEKLKIIEKDDDLFACINIDTIYYTLII